MQLSEKQKEAMIQHRVCPKCDGEMRPTYEPYELRCWECGFWWDTYTNAEVDVNNPRESLWEYDEANDGWSFGMTDEFTNR
jgi:hypothetical protein